MTVELKPLIMIMCRLWPTSIYRLHAKSRRYQTRSWRRHGELEARSWTQVRSSSHPDSTHVLRSLAHGGFEGVSQAPKSKVRCVQ